MLFDIIVHRHFLYYQCKEGTITLLIFYPLRYGQWIKAPTSTQSFVVRKPFLVQTHSNLSLLDYFENLKFYFLVS